LAAQVLDDQLYRAERAFLDKDIAFHQLKCDNEILVEKTKEYEVTIATLRAKVDSLERLWNSEQRN
jgi:hypothetical protein